MADAWGSSNYQEAVDEGTSRRRLKWVLGGTAAALIVGGGLAYYFLVYAAPRPIPIEVAVSTPTLLKGGAVQVSVTVTNPSRDRLLDGELVLELPGQTTAQTDEGTASSTSERPVVEVGDLDFGAAATRSFSVTTELSPGSAAPVRAVVSYRTERGAQRFAVARDVSLVVTQPAVSLNIDIAPSVARNDPFSATVRYRNNETAALSGARLALVLPRGISVVSATPQAGATGEWQLPVTAPGASGAIELRLVARNDAISPLGIRATVTSGNRQIAEQAAAFSISADPLGVSVTSAGEDESLVNFSQPLSYSVTVSNLSQVVMKDIVVTARLGNLLNPATVVVQNASLSAGEPVITWRGVGNPRLQSLDPGASVTLNFNVKVVAAKAGSNLSAPVTVDVTSPTVPSGTAASGSKASDVATVKVMAATTFGAAAYWRDPMSQIANSGPQPPRVGTATTYVVRWSINPKSAGLRDATVTGVLPPGVRFTGVRGGVSATALLHDARTGRVTWNAGEVAADATARAAFQVEVVPAANQANRELKLLTDVALEATDAFTGVKVERETIDLTTMLQQGATGVGQGIVEP